MKKKTKLAGLVKCAKCGKSLNEGCKCTFSEFIGKSKPYDPTFGGTIKRQKEDVRRKR